MFLFWIKRFVLLSLCLKCKYRNRYFSSFQNRGGMIPPEIPPEIPPPPPGLPPMGTIHACDIDQFGFKSMASAIPGGLPRQTKDDAMPQAYTCSWTKAVHSLKYSSFVMLLEAPQIWRMKRYNVLETELVYTKQNKLGWNANSRNLVKI